MRHRVALLGLLAAAAAVAGGCGGALFACENADECAGAGAGARCEADGWCSVVDESCPSGHRYGEHSGDGKAGVCVDDAGTSGTTLDPTTLDPSTSTTPNPTIDPTTSSTTPDPTIDPTMATLESTSEATSSSEATTDTTSDGPQPVCGDRVVDATEDCEDEGPLATDCASLGWASGELSCARCSYDTSACVGCGPDGCGFEPCTLDDPEACDAGETCAEIVSSGMCTADCSADEHCSHPHYDTVCYMSEPVMGTCLISCERGPCPAGMTCAPVQPPVCVFL